MADDAQASIAGMQGKSPARVAAGRRNRKLRGPLTDEGRARLKSAALLHQPWRLSTGPRTPGGKASAAANGRRYTKEQTSVRQRRALTAEVSALIAQMRQQRMQIFNQK